MGSSSARQYPLERDARLRLRDRDALVAHELETRVAQEGRVRLRRIAREEHRDAEPLAVPRLRLARPQHCEEVAAGAEPAVHAREDLAQQLARDVVEDVERDDRVE